MSASLISRRLVQSVSRGVLPTSSQSIPLCASSRSTADLHNSRIPADVARSLVTRRLQSTQQHIPTSKGTIPVSLLSRDPDRPLPTLRSLSSARRWLRSVPIFAVALTVSVLAIFNYQKTSSPVVTATLYSLRTNPNVRAVLGDEVYFASKWAWISGEINLVQGRINTEFDVKGTKDRGTVKFVAARHGGRDGSFTTSQWTLHVHGTGEVLDLLQGMGDPLGGQLF